MTHLLLTVRWLDDRYHGLLSRNGPPEWPPSPFRLFQALVAGVARRGELDSPAGNALAWLQKLDPPIIIAPKSKEGQRITRFVPNNDGDKKFDRQDRLTSKPTMPTLMLDDKPEVHYLWDLRDQPDPPVAHVRDAARSLTSLGWGIDMAYADARDVSPSDIQQLQGIRWHPKPGAWRDEGMLRTPTFDEKTKQCTLCDLKHCYETAMNRIEHGKPLRTVDKPRVFDSILYASIQRPIGRPYCVFKLIDENEDAFRYPQAKIIHIAAMLRHLAKERMTNYPPADVPAGWIRSYVCGHESDEDKTAGKPHAQFSYLPLPSIGMQHTDPSIRRVMIAAPIGHDRWHEHLCSQLDGQLLKPLPNTALNGNVMLSLVNHDKVAGFYTQPSNVWASVTPVILPGHDDHKEEKTAVLICKALKQSGVEAPCKFEWSAISHFPTSLSAHKHRKDPNNPDKKIQINYIRPKYLLDKTAVHLKITFNDSVKIAGPLVIGSGRHCGLGLLAWVQ